MAVDPITAGLTFGSKIIDKIFPDKSEAQKAKLALLELEQKGELAELVESSAIVQAEANSDSWLAANWRPLTMMCFTTIIANNYILYPYISLFWADAPILELPAQMWDLLKIGIGGYIVGRSSEKVVKAYKKP